MPGIGESSYDVALSFAGEDREYVRAVAQALKDGGVRVFYDDYEQVSLWGKDLYSHLDHIYRKTSKYCVLFISEHYAKRVWTSHERRSAQARALEERTEYVLPVRFDGTPIDGLPPTIGYLDISKMPPEILARLIKEKVGPRFSSPGFPRGVDRLWGRLGIDEGEKEEQERVRGVAYNFYESLRRMSRDERIAVVGVLAFGCRGELPDFVHISLDYLSRMTRMSKPDLLKNLAAVRSLEIKVKVRESQFQVDEGDLLYDDKDLTLSYLHHPADDATEIVYEAVHCAADHFCMDHGIDVVAQLDFSRLSKEAIGLAARADTATISRPSGE